MPFYEYFCSTCKQNYKTFHGVEEKSTSCPACNSPEVTKTLPVFNKLIETPRNNTAGQRVERFIEEQREILKAEKQEARKDLK
jgi:putative FmdB family regulatory protein